MVSRVGTESAWARCVAAGIRGWCSSTRRTSSAPTSIDARPVRANVGSRLSWPSSCRSVRRRRCHGIADVAHRTGTSSTSPTASNHASRSPPPCREEHRARTSSSRRFSGDGRELERLPLRSVRRRPSGGHPGPPPDARPRPPRLRVPGAVRARRSTASAAIVSRIHLRARAVPADRPTDVAAARDRRSRRRRADPSGSRWRYVFKRWRTSSSVRCRCSRSVGHRRVTSA